MLIPKLREDEHAVCPASPKGWGQLRDPPWGTGELDAEHSTSIKYMSSAVLLFSLSLSPPPHLLFLVPQ